MCSMLHYLMVILRVLLQQFIWSLLVQWLSYTVAPLFLSSAIICYMVIVKSFSREQPYNPKGQHYQVLHQNITKNTYYLCEIYFRFRYTVVIWLTYLWKSKPQPYTIAVVPILPCYTAIRKMQLPQYIFSIVGLIFSFALVYSFISLFTLAVLYLVCSHSTVVVCWTAGQYRPRDQSYTWGII